MKIAERFATGLVLLLVIGLGAAIFTYEQVLEQDRDCITIHMRTFEHGNPSPNTVRLKKGEPACLRFTSDDATHGVNLPDFGIDSEPIFPGKWTYLRFTPEKSGSFSFVCTITCSRGHSQVKGMIIVEE